jgi:phosphopantetheinyl transferase (holo-ACP synthase)
LKSAASNGFWMKATSRCWTGSFPRRTGALPAPGKQAASCLAARFAAKEAFVKAMGTGLRDGICWTEIEVINDQLGKPSLNLSGRDFNCFWNGACNHTCHYPMMVAMLLQQVVLEAP